MKPRPPERAKAISELDALGARLDEVRAEARRLTELRAATERKLEAIGKNLGHLRVELEKSRATKPRTKK